MRFPRSRSQQLVAPFSVAIATVAQGETPAAPPVAPADPPRVEVAQPADPRASWIEEIIITAPGREQLAQDYGGSISAFSEDLLEARAIESINDLQFQIPSFVTAGGLP
jgi:outer membrane receptor protein involved in Fe transport